jgi:hypothetical protein
VNVKERRVASRRVAIVPRDVGVRGRRGKKVDARLDAAGLLTKVLLLELAGQVALDERGLACEFEAGGRVVSEPIARSRAAASASDLEKSRGKEKESGTRRGSSRAARRRDERETHRYHRHRRG